MKNPNNYPLVERNKSYCVKYPVNIGGLWYGVNVIDGGYIESPLYSPFESREDCQRSCDAHNRYHKFSKEYVRAICDWSIMGEDFIEPTENTPIK